MPDTLVEVAAYVAVGVPFGLWAGVGQARDLARDAALSSGTGTRHTDETDMPPAGALLLALAFWPALLAFLLCAGAWDAAGWAIDRLARVDRLPEVRARALREAEREVGLDELPSLGTGKDW